MNEKKPMLKISVGAFYYAINKLTEEGEFNRAGFEEIVKSPTIKNVSVSEESESTSVYASGKIYDTVSQTSSTDIDVELLAFAPEDLFAFRGEEISENGIVFSGGSKERPFVAIGYPEIKKNNKYRFVWYPKCKLVENSDEVATSEESFSEQTETLTFKAMPFNDLGHNRVVVDTETKEGSKITEEQFFSQVILEENDLVAGA